MNAKYVPATVLGALYVAVNQINKITWPHVAYILVRGNKQ